MLRKNLANTKKSNIAKIKYFLPSSSTNRDEKPTQQQSALNKIKKTLNRKYHSQSCSKVESKRLSKINLQSNQEELHSQINFNDDVSFQIVGIRDGPQKSHQIPNYTNHQQNMKKFNYPLAEKQSNIPETFKKNNLANKDLVHTFGNVRTASKLMNEQQIVQISKRISDRSNFDEIIKKITNTQQKKQFQKFLTTLQTDQNYQNTISMFTMMYFYEQKAKNKVKNKN